MAKPAALSPVAIYGMGRFGNALAGALRAAGKPPARTGGRDPGPAALLHKLKPGTIIMLSVRDDALPQVAAEFASLPGCKRFAFVHACGAWGPELLQPLAKAGAKTGAFHILQSFPPQGGASRVAGSWCCLAGPKPLLAKLRSMALALQTHPLELPDSARPAYHAAAVLASNALVAILAQSRDLLLDAGLEPEAAGAMLIPLVMGTLQNVAELGPEKALTGPVARGDYMTLRRHLKAMNRSQALAYRKLMVLTTAFAEKSRRITHSQARALRAVLFD